MLCQNCWPNMLAYEGSRPKEGAQMRDHVTETSASPLACPHCGCTDLLCAIALGEVLAATVCGGEDAPSTEEQHHGPLWDSEHWAERGAVVCRSCAAVELRFDELVPAALPAPAAAGPGVI